MARQIKITSDGTPTGTRVIDAETGESIKGIFSVEWEHTEPGIMPIVTLRGYFIPIEAIATVSEPVETTDLESKFRTYFMSTPDDDGV